MVFIRWPSHNQWSTGNTDNFELHNLYISITTHWPRHGALLSNASQWLTMLLPEPETEEQVTIHPRGPIMQAEKTGLISLIENAGG